MQNSILLPVYVPSFFNNYFSSFEGGIFENNVCCQLIRSLQISADTFNRIILFVEGLRTRL